MFSWTLGSILLAICLLALMAVAMDWPTRSLPAELKPRCDGWRPRWFGQTLARRAWSRSTGTKPSATAWTTVNKNHGVLGVPPQKKRLPPRTQGLTL